MPVPVGVLADEDVEVAVAGHDVQRVAARARGFSNQSNVRCWLSGRKQLLSAPVMNEKRASVCGGCATKLSRQLGTALDADEVAPLYALARSA